MGRSIARDSVRVNQQGIYFPLSLWLTNEISIHEKIMIMEIQRNPVSTNADLAFICQSSESLITKSIKRLADQGILSAVGKGEDRQLLVNTTFTNKILKESGFSGVWMPISLWNTPLISPILKFLLLEIVNLDSGDGCKESNEYFANFLQVSPTQASRHISQLVKNQLISTTTIKSGRKTYLNDDLSNLFNQDIETLLPKTKPSNTRKESVNLSQVIDTLFVQFWDIYPNKKRGDIKAREKYHQVLRQGVAHDQVMNKLSTSMLSSHWSCGRVPLASAWLSQEFL